MIFSYISRYLININILRIFYIWRPIAVSPLAVSPLAVSPLASHHGIPFNQLPWPHPVKSLLTATKRVH